MLLTGNVDDGVVRADGVEGVLREIQLGDVLAHEPGPRDQLAGQLDLRFGEVHARDFKGLAQQSGHRHARAATGVEDARALRQTPDEFLKQLHILRGLVARCQVFGSDGVVTGFDDGFGIHVYLYQAPLHDVVNYLMDAFSCSLRGGGVAQCP